MIRHAGLRQKDLATGLRIESERVSKWERNGEITFMWRGEMRWQIGKIGQSNHRHATCLSLHLCRWSG
jgi:hypothetical protein